MPAELSTVFPSWPIFAAAFVVFIVAELIYVAFGFGAGLLAVGTLALIMPEIKDVVVILLIVNIPVEIFVIGSSWTLVRWRGILLILVGVGAGILLGTWLLLFGTPLVLLTLLGLVLVVSGLGFAAAPGAARVTFPAWSTPLIGLSSGILAGLFGTGGPPLIFYYQLQGIPKALFRSSLMSVFFLMTAVRLPSYIVSGLVTVPRLYAACALFPAVIIGAAVGHRIHIQLEEITFRRLVGVALAAIGLILLLRHLG